MAEIKLYDYEEIDEWGWGMFYCIGQGNLSASAVVPLIEAIPEDEEILVKVNSCGGFVFDGWAIYNALKNHKAKVTVRIDGLAASIASIIAMAGDEIIMAQASMMMVHKPSGFCFGDMTADDMKREANALDQIQAVLNSIYKSKTGLDEAVIDNMINAETWLTPDLAKTLGFANSIANTVTEEEVSAVVPENIFNHLFKNANTTTMAYANKTIKINKSMNNQEALKNSTDAVNKSNTLLEKLSNWFDKNFKNETEEPTNASSDLDGGGKIYYDGVLGVGTEVFTDEEMTTHPEAGDHDLADGNFITTDEGGIVTVMEKKELETEDSVEDLKNEIEALKNENAQLIASNEATTKALNASNSALQKIADTKSKFVPEDRKTTVDRNHKNVTQGLDLSTEARNARKQEILNKNKKK